MKPKLTLDALLHEAKVFYKVESKCDRPDLLGVTDGK